MSAQVEVSLPVAQNWPKSRSLRNAADIALNLATRFWFVILVIGQLFFAFTVAAVYSGPVVRGHLQGWNRFLRHGYVAGDGPGNLAVGIHLLSAVIIILVGTIQLLPIVRRRAPMLHRWLGRVYIVTAFTVSLAGLYMMWGRGTVGDLSQHVGTSILALVIMFCAVMALRHALARNFKAHRPWALRLYMAVSASLFIRAGVYLSLFLNHGPFGFDPATFTGPFLTFVSYAQYVVPLALLELYLRTKERGGVVGRFAMAVSLFALTLGLGVGILAIGMGTWVPALRKAFDQRISIAETLSATLAAHGVDEALEQYRTLKAARNATYNFDVGELNTLGYELLRVKKHEAAIRIFRLNTEAYPSSSNAFDSLGEAYLDAGDKARALANYRKAVQLDPKNAGARAMLQKLESR